MKLLPRPDLCRRYMTSVAASATGRNAYFVIVAWMGVDLSQGPAFVAILLATGSLAEFLTSNLGGMIVDRYERRLICLICDTLRMMLMAATMVGLVLFQPMAVLAVSWTLYAVIDRTYLTALQAMIPTLAPASRLMRVNSISYISMQAGNLVAAVAAGTLLMLLPCQLTFLLPLGCHAVSFWGLSIRDVGGRGSAAKRHPPFRLWDRGVLPIALPHGPLRLLAVIYGLMYAMGMLVSVLASALVLSQLDGTALEFGYLEAFWAAGSIAGCACLAVSSPRVLGQAPLLLISGCVLSIFLVIQNLFVSFLQMTVLGVTYNIARILVDVHVQRSVPMEALGRCRAQIHTVCVAFSLLLYGVVAIAGNRIQPAMIFGCFGLLMVMAGAVVLMRSKRGVASRGWRET